METLYREHFLAGKDTGEKDRISEQCFRTEHCGIRPGDLKLYRPAAGCSQWRDRKEAIASLPLRLEYRSMNLV